MRVSDRACEYCEVMSIPCDGTQDCCNCVDRGLTCQFPCDSDTDSYSDNSDSCFDPGWETFYARQARILIMNTECDNLAAHLPVIRDLWVRSSRRVKELYWDDEAGRMTLAKTSWDSPISTMRGITLYAAHQFQSAFCAVQLDDSFWLSVYCAWI